MAVAVLAWFMTEGFRFVYERVAYDDSPPMVVHAASLRRSVLAPGDALEYTITDYDKRDDCHPPKGRGALRFRVLSEPGDDPFHQRHWWWLDDERDSRAPPGQHMRLNGYSRIPLPPLAPGRYVVQWEATYFCARGRTPVVHYGPEFPFEVRAP